MPVGDLECRGSHYAGSEVPVMTPKMPRAARVPLHIPITYRVVGHDDWWEGRIVNISESGVLFSPAALEPGAPLEMVFSSPVSVGSLAAGKQVCVGEVVRIDTNAAGARFEECRFLLEA